MAAAGVLYGITNYKDRKNLNLTIFPQEYKYYKKVLLGDR
jgi:hypothetical protein